MQQLPTDAPVMVPVPRADGSWCYMPLAKVQPQHLQLVQAEFAQRQRQRQLEGLSERDQVQPMQTGLTLHFQWTTSPAGKKKAHISARRRSLSRSPSPPPHSAPLILRRTASCQDKALALASPNSAMMLAVS